MKKHIVTLFAIAALVFASSCAREGTLYDIPAGSACVSFPSSTAIFEMVAADGNKITIELWRGNTAGSATIPVTITDETGGVFTPAKEQFDFAAGEAVAKLDFQYPDINAMGGEVYKIRVKVASEQLSPSGIGELTITAKRKLTRVLLGKGEWYSDFFEKSWPQEIYTTEEAPSYYILPNCWAPGTDFTFTMSGGKPVWAADFDSGYTYGKYGNIWIKPGACTIENGVLRMTVVSYHLPKIGHNFGDAYEAFTLPEGVTLR